MNAYKKKPKTRQGYGRSMLLSLDGQYIKSSTSITSQRLGNILAQSLAAYVLLRSKEPVSGVMQDLFKIENEAAALVTTFCGDKENVMSLRGTLAGVFSVVPIGQGNSVRDVTPKKMNPPLKEPKKLSQKRKKNA